MAQFFTLGPYLDAVDHAAFDEVFESPGEVLGADAVHGGAEAAVVIEADNALVLIGEAVGHAIDEMNLSADGELGAFRSLFDERDELLCGAESVGFLADFPAAFGMDDDLDAGIFGAHLVDVAGQKALMDGAMALPEQNAAGREALGTFTSRQGPRVPDGHLIERDSHGVAGVAAQVLVGQEEDALASREGPPEGSAGVGRGADQAAAARRRKP